jgi:hypothetical protein
MKNSYAAADDLPSIFQGVGILPTQYNDLHRRKFTLEGERRLLFAVLEDAIRCYLRDADKTSIDRRPAYREAAAWLSSGEKSGPFAFINVCEALNINANRLFSGLQDHSGRLKRSTFTHRLRACQ